MLFKIFCMQIKHNKFKPFKPESYMDEQGGYYAGDFNESNLRIRDLEEKQRILKDRLLLIGKNLIETKEDINQKILDIKKDIQILKQNMDRMLAFLETVSSELSKFARKEDLEILSKQAKMFQPLNLKIE